MISRITVSILPVLSKVYEPIFYNQLLQHSEQFLNSIFCGFPKAHNTQYEIFKLSTLDKENKVVVVMATLECYDLDKTSYF